MAPLLYIQYFSEINFLKTYSDVKIGSVDPLAIALDNQRYENK